MGIPLALALAVWSPVQAQTAGGEEGRMMMARKMMMDGRSEMMEARMKMLEGRLLMLEGRENPKGRPMMEGKPKQMQKMKRDCQEMKARKQKLKQEAKAQYMALSHEVAEMNRADDDEKIELIAKILTRLVEQELTMDAKKSKMEEEMKKHMTAHMRMGGGSMLHCPMMQDTKDTPDTKEQKEPDDAHKEHHE